MGCDHALSTELGATVAAPIAGSPLEYAFDHPRQRPYAAAMRSAGRSAGRLGSPVFSGPRAVPQIRSALCRDSRTE
jgi:hypothetical protein